ncbi:hypothetical protein [Brevibacillus laterosporus]|uniref:hypothetical protein n=1 Tax=Brevibacillus laterosporus TaxID=1465 RepID=UPI00215BB0D7|nr:hypothetical protein [Brevibacillus laterosporus]MCR8994643.1 hypothetical protein [Brevibacillus laterosporus]
MKVLTTIPVHFEEVNQLDSRFTKVKIWLMHLGKNYNGSIFTREAVESAMDTLKNTPILGYVEESKLGEKDFRGHEVELVVEGGNLKTKYIGQAYGVIPENCNPRFEVKKGDFNNDLEYLVVDGLMWTKFDDAISILNSHQEVSQSMELHDEYDGYWNEKNDFVFTKFSFYGACLLGQDVLPAMQKASVEISFSNDVSVYQEEIAKKLEEYMMSFNNGQVKEVEDVTIEGLLAKFSTTVEDLAEKGVDVNTYSVEELEVKLTELFEQGDSSEKETDDIGADTGEEEGDEGSDNSDTDEGGDASEGNGDSAEGGDGQGFSKKDSDDATDKLQLSFELSHDDVRRKLYQGLDEHIQSCVGGDSSWNYIVSVFDSYFIAEDDYGRKFHMIGYQKDGDNIALGEVKEVFAMFLTQEEKGALELMRSSFEQYKAENTELKAFKQSVCKAQHEAQAEELFEKFNKLSAEEVADLRENVHHFTIEALESSLFERLGRKTANFSVSKPNTTYNLKINIAQTEDKDIGGYSHLFKKHGFTK